MNAIATEWRDINMNYNYPIKTLRVTFLSNVLLKYADWKWVQKIYLHLLTFHCTRSQVCHGKRWMSIDINYRVYKIKPWSFLYFLNGLRLVSDYTKKLRIKDYNHIIFFKNAFVSPFITTALLKQIIHKIIWNPDSILKPIMEVMAYQLLLVILCQNHPCRRTVVVPFNQ